MLSSRFPIAAKVLRHAMRMAAVLLLSGLLGATMARFAPGYGEDERELDAHLNEESRAALRSESAQADNILTYYAKYLWALARGDFGYSETMQEPVRQLLAERLPQTLLAVTVGLAVGCGLALLFALAAVFSRAVLVDAAFTWIASTLLCVPAAALALCFVLMRAPGRFAIALIVFPKIFQYARSLFERCAEMPHVLSARAKGLSGFRILCFHIFPVCVPQLFALAGISVSLAFAAAIPVEVLCDLPGAGQLVWKAALNRDMALLLNLTMIVTLITLLANAIAEWVTPSRYRGAA